MERNGCFASDPCCRRLLLTYAVRHGELDGKVYHGIEAVLSDTDGRTWQWSTRFYLFRWHMHESMHSCQSVQLEDGRILTVFFYHYDAPNHGPFPRADPPALNVAMCETITWSADDAL
jgi:hypothetical protein